VLSCKLFCGSNWCGKGRTRLVRIPLLCCHSWVLVVLQLQSHVEFVFVPKKKTAFCWMLRVSSNYENYQQDATVLVYCSLIALQVASDIFAHHQEHLNCIYNFWYYSLSGCRLLSWMSWNWVLAHPWQQPSATWWIIPKVVNAVKMLLMMSEDIARNV